MQTGISEMASHDCEALVELRKVLYFVKSVGAAECLSKGLHRR